jgi:hypothetical protein
MPSMAKKMVMASMEKICRPEPITAANSLKEEVASKASLFS